MSSKTFKPKNARLISIFCSIMFLTGCGGGTTNLDRAEKAAELTKQAYDRGAFTSKAVPPIEVLDYWNVRDETDDFGDRTIMLTTYSENGVGPSKSVPYGDSLQLGATCLGKDSTIDGKFYITVGVMKYTDLQVIGSPKSVDIRFDGGNPTNVPVYVRASILIHLENASKYISKILNASTFSVRFEAQERTYSGTFQVQGFSKYLSNFKSAGCPLQMD